ncbi:T9SS type A sorting domain-containing protein [Mariniphaga sp.]|uniref:T9SS type A sorting domain-containing protein n=1 Tax=Mariniphaga sp. TaxID=1954475 RepID=UPI00356AAF5B
MKVKYRIKLRTLKNTFTAILIILSFFQAKAQSEQILMSDFMGANTNVAAYDYGFLSDLSVTVKWIREYHNWNHYEAANDYYKWDNITRYPHTHTWPNHNKFMDACHNLGVQVLIDVLENPSWVGSTPIPNNTGSGTNASDYMERLDFLGQLVARYGSKKFDNSLLKTTDKVSGLNYIKYYEDENEPDYWWKTPQWPASNYAKYCNAAHDGYGVETSDKYPLLGIKSVDPDAKHVLAGMAAMDSTYFHEIIEASQGRVPFDVLNVHMYCTNRSKGYSPENEIYGYEKGFSDFFKWRNRVLPDVPVWITEFGWDTYLSPDNKHSYIYAPFEQQANYLMRSFFIFLKMGFKKAFMFMATDGNSSNLTQYSSSGLFKDRSSGYEKKPSWYYLATMQHVLGDFAYNRTIAYAQKVGGNEVYCLEFVNPETNEKVYALWTRQKNSPADNGSVANYQLDLGFIPKEAYSVFPENLNEQGEWVPVENPGAQIDLRLTETPQFLVVSEKETGFDIAESDKFTVNVFPNPSNGMVKLSVIDRTGSNVNIAVYSSTGQLVQSLLENAPIEGEKQFLFGEDFLPGIYFIQLKSEQQNITRKLIIQ